MRNGEQLLLALVIPIGIIVAGRFLGSRVGLTMDVLAPSVLALAIWSTCFTSQAIMTGFERRYGVLERLSATPLGRSGLLAVEIGAGRPGFLEFLTLRRPLVGDGGASSS